MLDKVSRWRNSHLHRRCIFCKGCVHRGGIDHSHYICVPKSVIRTDYEAGNVPRPFCALFELKPLKEDSK